MKGYARITSFNPSSHNLSSFQSNETNHQKTIDSSQENKGMKTHDSETGNVDAYAKIKPIANAAPKLQRTFSVSSSMQPSRQMSTMNRTFSIRRSSSVSEEFSRIRDPHSAPESPTNGEDEDDDKNNNNNVGSAKKLKKTTRVLKACKRILGL